MQWTPSEQELVTDALWERVSYSSQQEEDFWLGGGVFFRMLRVWCHGMKLRIRYFRLSCNVRKAKCLNTLVVWFGSNMFWQYCLVGAGERNAYFSFGFRIGKINIVSRLKSWVDLKKVNGFILEKDYSCREAERKLNLKYLGCLRTVSHFFVLRLFTHFEN